MQRAHAHSRVAQLVDQDEMYQWYPEAMEFVQNISKENGIEQYLDLVVDCKKQVDIPVFASINCYSTQNWISFSQELENAGADGIELNISIFPKDEHLNKTIWTGRTT